MVDIQEKVGGGISMLQDSLNQGKQKIQTAQQLSRYQKQLQDQAAKRAELVLQLGEEVYQEIRNGDWHDAGWQEKAEPIKELDRRIFQIKQAIENLKDTHSDISCPHCGAPLAPGDKFCGSCGEKIEPAHTRGKLEVQCPVCEEMNPTAAHFCRCCGHRISGEQEGEV